MRARAPWHPAQRPSEQTSKLTRNDRRASPSPQASSRKQHQGRTSQESEHDVKKAAAPEGMLIAQSTQSLERSRARLKSSGTSKGTRVQLRWNDLDHTLTEAKGSSTDDEQGARSPPASSRGSRSRSRSSRIMRSSPRAESSSSSSSESSIHMRPKHILKPPKYDGAGSFETFLAQFQNCASHNKWTKRESSSCTFGAP